MEVQIEEIFLCHRFPSPSDREEYLRFSKDFFSSSLFFSALHFVKRYVNSHLSPSDILNLLSRISLLKNNQELYAFLIRNLNPRLTVPLLSRNLDHCHEDRFISFVAKKWLFNLLVLESSPKTALFLLKRCHINLTKKDINSNDLIDFVLALNDEVTVYLSLRLVKTNPMLKNQLLGIGIRYLFGL